jgi:hypothetical protein
MKVHTGVADVVIASYTYSALGADGKAATVADSSM